MCFRIFLFELLILDVIYISLFVDDYWEEKFEYYIDISIGVIFICFWIVISVLYFYVY